jgi:signal peptidase I
MVSTTAGAAQHQAAVPPGSPTGAVRRRRRTATLGVVLLTALAARAWVVEPLRIPTSSMAPTLAPGEHVVVEKVTGYLGRWSRGDLVVLTSPRGGQLLLKRLVGLGGDRVEIRDGLLLVNNKGVEEPYVDHSTVDSVFYGPVAVPEGEALLLGDNRATSEDSRHFGTVPVDELEGKVVAVVWPPASTRVVGKEGWGQ